MNNKITVETILKKIKNLQGRNDLHTVFCDILEISAIEISNQFDIRNPYWENRENRYKDIINKYNDDERKLIKDIFTDLFILLSQMSEPDGIFNDYLGKLYMFSNTSSNKSGQFFTPYSVSKLCAKTIIDKNDKAILNHQIITLNEPTCGSGGMILAGVEMLKNLGINYKNRLLVVCSDIDKRCVHMTYLQLALAGVPAIILHQNTLTQETFDEWHTPALCLNWMRFRKTVKYINYELTQEEEKDYEEWNKSYDKDKSIEKISIKEESLDNNRLYL